MRRRDPLRRYVFEACALSMLFLSAITALLLLAIIAVLLVSILVPSRRIWPPPSQRTWQFLLVWSLTLAAFGLLILIGIRDWNSLGWSAWLRWPVGLGLIVAGNGLAWLGVEQLGMKTTSGAEGTLITGGLYRYSRNPQYLGDMLILLGWIVLSASAWVTPLAVVGVAAFALTPLAEESWLTEKHGEAYRAFCRSTPRYLGFARSAN